MYSKALTIDLYWLGAVAFHSNYTSTKSEGHDHMSKVKGRGCVCVLWMLLVLNCIVCCSWCKVIRLVDFRCYCCAGSLNDHIACCSNSISEKKNQVNKRINQSQLYIVFSPYNWTTSIAWAKLVIRRNDVSLNGFTSKSKIRNWT